MQSPEKFSLLRTILRTLGLSAEAVDDIIERIVDFLAEKDEKSSDELEYPYLIRDDFLSPAEHSFYLVLKSVMADQAVICPKVALGDLFFAKSSDPSKYRTFSNRIDRKHVDFLLCDSKTVRPLVGIELDDKSHRRSDRQARDEFVEKVFAAAKLPLVRIPVRQSYSGPELSLLLRPHISPSGTQATRPQAAAEKSGATPRCPKCGSEMVLRTAKSGANRGEQFWGCPNYPRCRGMLRYEAGPGQ
jgi:hypothetical protein